MTQAFVRNRVTWLAYAMLAIYGYFLNIIGPITPFLKDELSLSYTVSSLHFSAFAAGMIAVGLFGHRLIQRIGRWNALWLAAFGLSVFALLLIGGRSPALTISAAFLMGLIGSLILAVVPSVLSDQYGERRAVALSEANVISSTISALAPVLVGWFAGSLFGWRAAMVIAAIAVVLIRFGFGKVNFPPDHASADAQQPNRPLPRLYWIYWVALVVSVSIEFCMISWSADYLETGLGMAKASAAQAVSLFLGSMILGRWASSRLVLRYSSHQVVTGSLIVASVGFLIYWGATTAVIGMAGLFITGLGVAALYPLILALAIGSSNGSTVRASAVSSLASGTAILALPLTLGRIADAMGIHAAFGVIVVLLILGFAITQGAARMAHRSAVLETTL